MLNLWGMLLKQPLKNGQYHRPLDFWRTLLSIQPLQKVSWPCGCNPVRFLKVWMFWKRGRCYPLFAGSGSLCCQSVLARTTCLRVTWKLGWSSDQIVSWSQIATYSLCSHNQWNILPKQSGWNFIEMKKIRLELASVLVQVDTLKTNTDIKNSTSFKSFSNGKPGKPTDFRLHFGRHLTQEEACQRCGPTAEMGPTKSTRKDRLTSFSPPLSDRLFS